MRYRFLFGGYKPPNAPRRPPAYRDFLPANRSVPKAPFTPELYPQPLYAPGRYPRTLALRKLIESCDTSQREIRELSYCVLEALGELRARDPRPKIHLPLPVVEYFLNKGQGFVRTFRHELEHFGKFLQRSTTWKLSYWSRSGDLKDSEYQAFVKQFRARERHLQLQSSPALDAVVSRSVTRSGREIDLIAKELEVLQSQRRYRRRLGIRDFPSKEPIVPYRAVPIDPPLEIQPSVTTRD